MYSDWEGPLLEIFKSPNIENWSSDEAYMSIEFNGYAQSGGSIKNKIFCHKNSSSIDYSNQSSTSDFIEATPVKRHEHRALEKRKKIKKKRNTQLDQKRPMMLEGDQEINEHISQPLEAQGIKIGQSSGSIKNKIFCHKNSSSTDYSNQSSTSDFIEATPVKRNEHRALEKRKKIKKKRNTELDQKTHLMPEGDQATSDHNIHVRKHKKKKRDVPTNSATTESIKLVAEQFVDKSEEENRQTSSTFGYRKRTRDKMKDTFSTLDNTASTSKQFVSTPRDEHRAKMQEKLTSTPLSELIEEANDAALEHSEELKSLSVMLPWPIPQLHSIATRLYSVPNEKQKEKINELGIKLKTGIFSQAEDKRIKWNWKNFCRLHDLDAKNPTPFVRLMEIKNKTVLPAEEKIKFLQFIAHRLDNRILSSVYKRFQRIYNDSTVSGRFTCEEDKIIIEYLKTRSSSTPYVDLARILCRNNSAVEKRCITLLEKHSPGTKKRIEWDSSKIKEFLENMLEIIESYRIKDLKHRKIESHEWCRLSEKMNIPVKKLQRGWVRTIYPRIFTQDGGQHLKSLKMDLIDILIESGANDWRSVDWNGLASQFQGFTGSKLYEIMKNLVKYHVPLETHNDLKASLRYLKFANAVKLNSRKVKKIEVEVLQK